MSPSGVTVPPAPLPPNILQAPLRAHIAATLPNLRAQPIPPNRHPSITLLIYWFPADTTADFAPCEFALRQSLSVLGSLPTVIVTHDPRCIPTAFRRELSPHLTVHTSPTLVPGDIWTMSIDCIARLHTYFNTKHVLIVQPDGWPVRDDLSRYLRYDYIGAPNTRAGLPSRLADLLGLTVLNGGFSLRTHRLCRAAARRWFLWKHLLRPGMAALSEDIFYTQTLRLADPLYRLLHRFAPAPVARTFSEDTLDALLPPAPTANPMGFHRASTYAALFAPTPTLTVVTVVRDHACYSACLRNNPVLRGARFVAYDNTHDNLPIPVRYNSFLDTMPPDTEWILFAHEDFEPREDPRPLLAKRSPLFPWGLIGTRALFGWLILPLGTLSDSDRNGQRLHLNTPPLPYTPLLGDIIENFDCCGFFVHADFFRTWHLRFDPACAWDLYAEDLCYAFRIQTAHYARRLPLRAHHYSRGNPHTNHFRATLAHLNTKYRQYHFAGGTCTLTIGGRPPLRTRLLRAIARRLLPHRFGPPQ